MAPTEPYADYVAQDNFCAPLTVVEVMLCWSRLRHEEESTPSQFLPGERSGYCLSLEFAPGCANQMSVTFAGPRLAVA